MIERIEIDNLAKELIWTQLQLKKAENDLKDINIQLIKTSKLRWFFWGLRNFKERSLINECKSHLLFLEEKSIQALNEFLVQEVWVYLKNNPNTLLHFKAIEQKSLKEKMLIELLETQIDLLPPVMFGFIGPHVFKITWDFIANRTYYFG